MAATSDASAGHARRLHLVFDDPKAFAGEYARNLSRGGAMIASSDAFEMREVVEVVLEAPFAGAKHVLAAEVVHAAGGCVAVQFLDGAPELREKLEPLRERAERAPQPAADGLLAGDDVDALAEGEGDFDFGEAEDGAALEGFETTSQTPDESDPNERTFKARAERAATRVAVQVQAPTGKALSGRTRDVSHTGVLLSVDGDELPVGRDVHVSLVHPATGEAMTVPGKVVRHLEGEGVVGAVAVELRPGERSAEVQKFVAEIREADAAEQRAGIRGPLEELGGASLLQMFAALSKRGTLTVTHGVEEGCVCFEEGLLVSAQVGSVQGVKALARIFSWREGLFEFRGNVATRTGPKPTLAIEAAILDAVRMLDEGQRLSGPVIAPTARLELVRERLDETGTPLGKTEEAVIELAAAGFTVRRILDVIPENDATIRVAIAGLLERGVLRLA
ncbi:MAG: hypothetical protein DCC71_13195 [Proteobacteria bacterium]|nr:MAG: hypothetical protein DCC71_13195 [Pseudomonadota bacterium]